MRAVKIKISSSISITDNWSYKKTEAVNKLEPLHTIQSLKSAMIRESTTTYCDQRMAVGFEHV
jgi:hypothetical protein